MLSHVTDHVTRNPLVYHVMQHVIDPVTSHDLSHVTDLVTTRLSRLSLEPSNGPYRSATEPE